MSSSKVARVVGGKKARGGGALPRAETVNQIPSEKIIEIWANLKVKRNINSVDCWTPTTINSVNGSGYKQVTWNGIKVLVHHVAYRYKSHGKYTIPTGGDDDPQISHICGNRLCCNPRHLESVPRVINESRRYCHQHLWDISKCPHDGALRKNRHGKWVFCKKCIFVPLNERVDKQTWSDGQKRKKA